MTIPNWTDLNLYHYLAIGGGGVVIVALLLFFTPIARLKIPAVFLGVVGGLGAGAGLGVIVMSYYGYQLKDQAESDPPQQQPGPGGGPPGMMGGGPPGMMGGPPGMMGGGRGGRGPNSKTQLANLVTKLDLLTHHSLAVTLNAEQKKKVGEQIAKLGDLDELPEDKAKERLDALLVVLKDQRETLESAGYRWPGQGGGGGGLAMNPPNPFREPQTSKHLKSLQDRLEVKKAE